MAKFAGTLGTFRGSVGNLTFSHNKGGNFARIRQAPTNPNSERQALVRGVLSDLVGSWPDISADDKASWVDYANAHPRTGPLGETYTLTGMQAYIGLNAVLVDSGETALDEAPSLVTPMPQGSGGAVAVAFTTNIAVAITLMVLPPTGGKMVIWWNGPISAGADPDLRQARLVHYSAVNPTSPLAFDLPYAPPSGSVCKFWVGNMDAHGQRSTMVSAVATTP